MKTRGIVVSLIGLIPACLCLVRADGSALARAPDPYRFTESHWIWTEPKSNPPTNAYFRIAFDVTKDVKRAWLHSIMENNRGFWVSGKKVEFKPLKSSLAKSGRKYKKVINIGFEGPLLPHDSKEWAKLLADAGCHRFTDTGFCVRRNSRFLLVFSPLGSTIRTNDRQLLGKVFATTGRTEVKLERRFKTVRDVMTGDVLGRDIDSLEVSSAGPRIWLLETVD